MGSCVGVVSEWISKDSKTGTHPRELWDLLGTVRAITLFWGDLKCGSVQNQVATSLKLGQN